MQPSTPPIIPRGPPSLCTGRHPWRGGGVERGRPGLVSEEPPLDLALREELTVVVVGVVAVVVTFTPHTLLDACLSPGDQ